MLAILSPAKDMRVEPKGGNATLNYTIPAYSESALSIIAELQRLTRSDLEKAMKISPKLSLLNYDRYANWDINHNTSNSSQAILSFTGEAYRGLNASSLTNNEMEYSQKVLRIISGLYGVVRPLDLIQPYRLEMGTKLGFGGKKNLYDFWGSTITDTINIAVENSPGEKILINLASKEYSSAIDFKRLRCRVIDVSFYEYRNDQLKMITVYTKKARGIFARFLIQNQIENEGDLKAFDLEGYGFDNERSDQSSMIFIR
jgi:cytoplasmic iron level regulating protein YaaA (DUF328/UPF0246 family)